MLNKTSTRIQEAFGWFAARVVGGSVLGPTVRDSDVEGTIDSVTCSQQAFGNAARIALNITWLSSLTKKSRQFEPLRASET